MSHRASHSQSCEPQFPDCRHRIARTVWDFCLDSCVRQALEASSFAKAVQISHSSSRAVSIGATPTPRLTSDSFWPSSLLATFWIGAVRSQLLQRITSRSTSFEGGLFCMHVKQGVPLAWPASQSNQDAMPPVRMLDG